MICFCFFVGVVVLRFVCQVGLVGDGEVEEEVGWFHEEVNDYVSDTTRRRSNVYQGR